MSGTDMRSIVVACLLAAAAPRAAATADPAAPPVPADAVVEARAVQDALNNVRGLVASFTQTVESPGLPRPQVEHGTVYLLRPGRMRWEYDVPEGKLAIADGRQTTVYLPDEHRAITAPIDEDGTRTGVSLLLRPVDLVGTFEIAWAPDGRAGTRSLTLKPRAPHAEYDMLLLTPGPDHLVRALTVVEPLGARVIYRFDKMKRVDTLDDGLFRFVPPPGVEVSVAAP